VSRAIEAWLARLYTDAEVRERFLADPERALTAAAELSDAERRQLLGTDREGLQLHAQSLAAKRGKSPPGFRPRLRDRLRARAPGFRGVSCTGR
jgi:hypothetical protein